MLLQQKWNSFFSNNFRKNSYDKTYITLPKWISKAWPALLILIIGVIQVSILSIPSIDRVQVNDKFAQLLTVGGAIVVLVSVNEDFKDFRKRSMFSEFREYLKLWPLVRQNYQLDAEAKIITSSVSKAALSENKSWSTIDEGLIEVERRIEDLRNQINANRKESFEEIGKLNSDLKSRDSETKELIKLVSLVLDKSVMGDAKLQILGALLVLYGVIIDLFL